MRKPFLVCWKRHPPWFTKFEFEKFFSLFYLISTQRSYIHQKLDTNGCFAKLRAISNLFSFFLYTLYRPIALTSQILTVSSRCFLAISVRGQQPHTGQKLTILIQNYYKLYNIHFCFVYKSYIMYSLLICPPDAPAL